MQNAIVQLLDRLASLLGPLSPFAKAVVPAVLSVAIVAVNAVFAGSVDSTELTVALSGLVLSVVTYLVPNKPVASK